MTSLVDCLEAQAAAHPDRRLSCFLNADGSERRSYTYRAFSDHTRRVAAHLSRRARLRHGDRALLAYPPGLDGIVALFACARVGVIPVPVPPPSSGNVAAALTRIALVARDCQAAALLTTRALSRSCRSVAAASARRELACLPDLQWVTTDDIDAAARDRCRDDPNPILLLQYTSGSTGDPKGVIVSHANVIHNATSTLDHVPVGVSWLPQYHDMGLIGYYLFPVVTGGTTYGLSPFDFLRRPIVWLRTMSRVRATYASSPNFGFEYCLREDKVPARELEGLDLGSLRVLMNAAEPVRAETYLRFLERFAPCGLRPEAHVVAYGLAENTLAATHHGRRIVAVDKRLLQRGQLRVEDAAPRDGGQLRLVSCGRPLEGTRLRVVEPGPRTELGEGQLGEIWLSGTSTCHGYWGRPELSREVFGNRVASETGDHAPWLRTGDLGFVHEGELFVCGRIKDLIVVRGVNVYPHDIEAVVESASPKIRTGGVAAFTGDDGPETLVIVAEVVSVKDLPDAEAIARAVGAECSVSPHTIVFAPSNSVVKTTSGKISRSLTRRRWLDGELPVAAIHVCPAGDARQPGIAGLRRRIGRLVEISGLTGRADATLGDLGMDSLASVELLMEVRDLLDGEGAGALAEDVDVSLLHQLTVSELHALLDHLERDPAGAATTAWHRVANRRREHESDVSARMRADARLEPCGVAGAPAAAGPIRHVLFTGPTGFFGPFLLASLLRRTPCHYHVLTRAPDPARGAERVRQALRRARLWTPALGRAFAERVHVVCGDLSRPRLGLRPAEWEALAGGTQAICHNAALVNYVLDYDALRPHNVEGTRELLRLACTGPWKDFHHISTTFVFGWTVTATLRESDGNDEMASLDFGYSQTKWVAEQLVRDAERQGLRVRIYRPALISASTQGAWDAHDIAVRLLAFMINHGVAVDARNQLSFLPADIVADNIAAIFRQADVPGSTLHVTADAYYNMADITRLITAEYGYPFVYHEIPDFIAEMNRRCTRASPLYPLLDFFNRSHRKIAAMQLKRYNNDGYRAARDRTGEGRGDPSLRETVSYLMDYMVREGLIGTTTV
jgi:thioester reductase-like protein